MYGALVAYVWDAVFLLAPLDLLIEDDSFMKVAYF
jgi:hypothetical protein